ncbi:MAG: fibronectin type III domain-containing protein, partial [Bacteroidales bacterium]|nr:fibronectin type III domain-containing protein [Bacteroidales bacterium]
MKKVFLFLTMLLFAFTGTMRAESLTVHDGTTTNGYVPVYGFYADAYNKCEMVYPATELGEMAGGMINGMTFYATQTSVSWGSAQFQVFVAEVENATISAFAGPGTVVYEGSLSISGGEMVVTFNAPYAYAGGNLLVGVYQTSTGSYVTSTWKGETVTGASGSGYNYSSLASCSFSQKNFLPKTTFDYVPGGGGGALTTTPDVLDLGYRPNGAWMAPYVFEINATGLTTINALDLSGNYFTYNAEVPATIYANNPLEVELTTGEAEEGAVNSELTVLFSNRDAQQFNVTANAYNPVNGDVYEKATVVSSFPYNATAPASIYKNYALPTETEGADAVYKMTFANDVLLTAGTTGADGVVALYTEDFNGEGGPMADNNYEYNGPTINPGPVSMWFNYDYTGTNTWYGTSAAGGTTMWGYKITPAMLQELGLGECSIVTVETAARNSTVATYYDLVILKGGDTPDLENIVYYQEFTDFIPGYYFDLDLDEPQALGDDENIWIMFISDSEYAAYCGRYPVDTDNGKIWYSLDLSNWYSNTSYTPEIYTRFVELPTGREVTVNLADMTIRESKPAAGQIAEAEGLAMGTPKAQLKQNNNRVVVENDNIEDMYVKAGTYYLVAASTDTEFPVAIETAEVPAPEQAYIYSPMDGQTNVVAPYLAEWVLGDYTEEMQVLVGTQYPPQTALIDWTDYLVESAFITDLEPNQSYFMQVNERNAAGTTMGEIIAFTTPVDPVEGFAVENDELYPGDAAMFSWTANARTLKGYNIYKDGVKVNEAPITENSYAVEGLTYNMTGYNFQVSAVYDAGESALSDVVTVKMTGNGTVSGYVYDTDVDHPVAFATVGFLGLDEYMQETYTEFTTDEEGFFTGEL